MGLHLRSGGTGQPVLVLLHGLGATGEVWRGLTDLADEHWPGRWIVPDLPGHGRSPAAARYSFGSLAAEVAAALEPGARVSVLGHSLGGVVGLVLASGWFGVTVDAVCGLGIKLRWSPAELAKAAELAGRPNRVFETRQQAAERALRVAGLHGLVPLDSPLVDSSITEADGGWRLRVDQAAFGVGAPDVAGLLAAAKAEVLLAAGEGDPMCPAEHLLAVRPDAVVLAGLGHNAQVEDPAAVWPLVERLHTPTG